MADPGTTAVDDVRARYARPRRPLRRLLWLGGGIVLAAAALALVASSVLAPQVRWRDVGFDVVADDRVDVTFEVYADAGDVVRCQVRAADTRYGDVGQVEVDLGPLPAEGLQTTVAVRTAAPAVSASVRTCVPLP